MSLESLIGQPMAVELGRKWLARKTTHPLLLYGPDGVGKRTFALALAKALNDVAKYPGDRVAARPHGHMDMRIDAGLHPDVRVVDLAYQALIRDEEVQKQQNLRIETILAE